MPVQRRRAMVVEHAAKPARANDRIHVATALANDIDTIVSADADFDHVPAIRRVDPLDEAQRSRVLRS